MNHLPSLFHILIDEEYEILWILIRDKHLKYNFKIFEKTLYYNISIKTQIHLFNLMYLFPILSIKTPYFVFIY